ncbi:MAG: IMP dehydrogenase [Candidatus Falkowbacteria bacterium]
MKARSKVDGFFAKMDRLGLGLSFGDIRLKTGYSLVLPNNVDLSTQLTEKIGLSIPILSSCMDTVTEAKMAIAMAKAGGMGAIHKNLTPKEQADQVTKVKFHLNAFITNPICIQADRSVESVLAMKAKKEYDFFSFPVVDGDRKVIGIVTRNDFDFCRDKSQTIAQIMSADVLSADGDIDVAGAYDIMSSNKKKILPVLGPSGQLRGIYTYADVERIVKDDSHGYTIDQDGRLRVAAAIGVGDDIGERLELLAKAKADLLIIDTAHGDTRRMEVIIGHIKREYPDFEIMAGNVSEGDSAKRLAKAGADCIRVGQGPGSICTTRIEAGIGCPQATAIYNCAKALRGSHTTVCGDGGINFSGDITIALALGASTVMLGRLLAGTDEAPGIKYYRGNKAVKIYRGMGSLGAMLANKASRERYGQGEVALDKVVPEGIEGEVEYKGELAQVIVQLLGGLRSGLGYLGAANISELQAKVDFYRLTDAARNESHPHDIDNIKDAPNYTARKQHDY